LIHIIAAHLFSQLKINIEWILNVKLDTITINKSKPSLQMKHIDNY